MQPPLNSRMQRLLPAVLAVLSLAVVLACSLGVDVEQTPIKGCPPCPECAIHPVHNAVGTDRVNQPPNNNPLPETKDSTWRQSHDDNESKQHPIKNATDVQRMNKALWAGLRWTESIDVHPVRLRRDRGMKGIKHMVELLDLYHLCYKWPHDASLSRRATALALAALVATDSPDYHALETVDEKRFKQDSMSYLRAYHLASQFPGWDGAMLYRQHIHGIYDRINEHLSKRGVDQRMGFVLLAQQLGLDPAEDMMDVFKEGVISTRQKLSWYVAAPDRPYDLTHEIFAISGRGAKPAHFPSDKDKQYAHVVVPKLIEYYQKANNVDVVCELLVNLAELGLGGKPFGQAVREYVFFNQNKDGSFGDYSKIKRLPTPNYDVRIGGNLHTTFVCLWALVVTAPDRSPAQQIFFDE